MYPARRSRASRISTSTTPVPEASSRWSSFGPMALGVAIRTHVAGLRPGGRRRPRGRPEGPEYSRPADRRQSLVRALTMQQSPDILAVMRLGTDTDSGRHGVRTGRVGG